MQSYIRYSFLLDFRSFLLQLDLVSFAKEFFITISRFTSSSWCYFNRIFGLMIVGLLQVDFLMKDRKFQFKNRPTGYVGSALIGLAFAAGWTPCTGPILMSIIALAGTNPDSGFGICLRITLDLLFRFSIMISLFHAWAGFANHSQKIVKVGGWIMIAVGVLLFLWVV